MALTGTDEWFSSGGRSVPPLELDDGRYKLVMSPAQMRDANAHGSHVVGRYRDTEWRRTGDHYVAAKLYPPGEDPTVEGRMLRFLQKHHRWVLLPEGQVKSDEGTWILTEWVDGGTLAQRIARRKVTDLDRFADAFRPMLDPLRAMHRGAETADGAPTEGGVALGDIAAENLFWTGSAYIFGDFATCVAPDHELDAYGRPWYGPPGSARADICDAHACGVTLWAAVTGELPHQIYHDADGDRLAVRSRIAETLGSLPSPYQEAVGALLDAPDRGADKALRDAMGALLSAGTPPPRPQTPKQTAKPKSRVPGRRRAKPPRAWRRPRPPAMSIALLPTVAAVAAGVLIPQHRVKIGPRSKPTSIHALALRIALPGTWTKSAAAASGDGVDGQSSKQTRTPSTRLVVGTLPASTRLHDPLTGELRPVHVTRPAVAKVNGLSLLAYAGSGSHHQALFGYVAVFADHDEIAMCSAASTAQLAPCQQALATLRAAKVPVYPAIDRDVRATLGDTLDKVAAARRNNRGTIGNRYLTPRKPGLENLADAYAKAKATVGALDPPSIDVAPIGALADALEQEHTAWQQLQDDANRESRKDYNNHRGGTSDADQAMKSAIGRLRSTGYVSVATAAARGTR